MKENGDLDKWFTQIESKYTWWDRYVVFPYHRYIHQPISRLYYDLKHIPGNLKKWGMFVFYDRDWDYSFTLLAFEIKCRYQSKLMKKHGNALDSELHAKQAEVMAETLKRLREECYWDDCDFTDYSKGHIERNKDIQYVKDHFEELFKWWE